MGISPDRNIALRKQIAGWLSWHCESVAGKGDAGATQGCSDPVHGVLTRGKRRGHVQRWRDGLQCPRCHCESVINYDSYGAFQRYRCKNCGRNFNDKTRRIVTHAKIALRKLLLAIYALLRFNTSSRQTEAELDVSYRSLCRHVERIARALAASSLTLSGSVEIGEVYVSAGLKGPKRNEKSLLLGLSTRIRGLRGGDKPPVFTLVDRGTNDRYIVPTKFADESTVLLLLADHSEESLASYTD